MSTGYAINVHVRSDTPVECRACVVDGEIVRVGGLTLFIDAPDLERLHAVISARLAELGRAVDWKRIADRLEAQLSHVGCTCTFDGDDCCGYAAYRTASDMTADRAAIAKATGAA